MVHMIIFRGMFNTYFFTSVTVIECKSKFKEYNNRKQLLKKENGKFRTCKYAYCKGQLCKQFDGRPLNGFEKCD